jgi:hypothetical protein
MQQLIDWFKKPSVKRRIKIGLIALFLLTNIFSGNYSSPTGSVLGSFTKKKTASQLKGSVIASFNQEVTPKPVEVTQGKEIKLDKITIKLSSIETYFAAKDSQGLNHSITTRLVGAKDLQGEKSDNTLYFKNVLEDLDLRQELFDNHLKESFILKSDLAPKILKFGYTLNSSSQLTLKDDGSIAVSPKDSQEVIYTIDKPIVKDKNDQTINYQYKITPDFLYLRPLNLDQFAKVAYPITIDPLIGYHISGGWMYSENNPRSIARKSNGEFWVVFIDNASPGVYNLMVTHTNSPHSGETWATATLIAQMAEGQYSPVIAVDSNDVIHLAWSGQNGGVNPNNNILYTNSNMTWPHTPTNPPVIVTDNNQDQNDVVMAIDSENNVHLAWTGLGWNSNPNTRNVQYKKATKNPLPALDWDWLAPIESVNDLAINQQYLSMAVDSQNIPHLTWGLGNIYYQKRTGGGWQSPANVTNDADQTNRFPQMALDSQDNVHVTWQKNEVILQGEKQYIAQKYRQLTSSGWQAEEINLIPYNTDVGESSISLDSFDNVYITIEGWGNINQSKKNILLLKRTAFGWGELEYLTDESTDQNQPVLLWANYPIAKGVKTNIPKRGFTMSWLNGPFPSELRFYSTASWSQGYTFTNSNNTNSVLGGGETTYDIKLNFADPYSKKGSTDSPQVVKTGAYEDSTMGNNKRSLAIDSQGRLWTVYGRKDGGDDKIFVAYSDDDGLTWTEEQVNDDAPGYPQFDPAIAVDSKDNIHVVWSGAGYWMSSYPDKNNIYYRGRTSWGGWYQQALITDIDADQAMPTIAVDSLDMLIIAWSGLGWGSNPELPNIQYLYSWFGAYFYDDIEHVTDNDKTNLHPSVGIDPNNNIHLVWDESVINGGITEKINVIYRKRLHYWTERDPSIAWFPEEKVTNSLLRQEFPSLALDSINNIHVVWKGQKSSADLSYDIYYLSKSSSGWLAQPEAVTDEGQVGNNYDQIYPSVTVDSLDNVYALWKGKGWGTNMSNFNLRFRQRTSFGWQAQMGITDRSYDQGWPVAMWANYPRVNNAKTNVPQEGIALVFTGQIASGYQVEYFGSTDFRVLISPTVRIVDTMSEGLTMTGYTPGYSSRTPPPPPYTYTWKVETTLDNFSITLITRVIDCPASGSPPADVYNEAILYYRVLDREEEVTIRDTDRVNCGEIGITGDIYGYDTISTTSGPTFGPGSIMSSLENLPGFSGLMATFPKYNIGAGSAFEVTNQESHDHVVHRLIEEEATEVFAGRWESAVRFESGNIYMQWFFNGIMDCGGKYFYRGDLSIPGYPFNFDQFELACPNKITSGTVIVDGDLALNLNLLSPGFVRSQTNYNHTVGFIVDGDVAINITGCTNSTNFNRALQAAIYSTGDITLNTDPSCAFDFEGLMVGKKITFNKIKYGSLGFDPNLMSNPPPGFTQLINPSWKEKAP